MMLSDVCLSDICQRSKSPGHFTHRCVNASGSCSGERGEPTATLLFAGLAARGALVPTEVAEGWGHIVAAARLQLV